MGRRRRSEHPEEHENHERWLVTYADMVTLLMVLFIVMFAMSQVDQEKYAALKNGLANGFGGADSAYVRADYAAAMDRWFPRNRRVTIKGAGHWVHSEQPAVFVEVLRRFLV